MKHALIASAVALLLTGGASAQTQPQPPKGPVPFINAVHRSGQMEIALAKMAQAQAKNPKVKSYAQMLETDHQQAAQELAALAKTKGVTLASDAALGPLDPVVRLEKLKGHAFDLAYVDQMIRDHTQAIKDFQQAAAGADAEVKAFAAKTLPALQKHLQDARNLKKAL